MDFNQLKKRMNTFEQNLQKVKESMSNEIQLMLNKKMEENEKQLKKAVRLLRQRREIQVLELHLRHSTEDIKLYLSFLRSFHRKNRLC